MSSALYRLLKQAETHLRSGNAAAAQSACEQALKKAPRNPDVLFLLATSLLWQNRAADALPLIERVLAVDPKHGAALEQLGLAHLMLGRSSDAEQVLQRASVMTGAPASVFMRLGVAIFDQGRIEESLPPLRRAVSMNARDVDGQLNLGRSLAASGDYAGASDCFHAAQQLAPQRPDGAFNLGVLALHRDDLDDAKRWLERALALAPGSADVELNLAIALHRKSELSLAYQHYSRAIAAALASPQALEGLAAVCIGLGRTREAASHLRALLALEPSNVAARGALADTSFLLGELDEAKRAADHALHLDASHAASYATLANVHLVRDELADAIQVLQTGYSRTQASTLLGMLTYQLRQACDWDEWHRAWQKMASLLETDAPLSSPFWLLCEPISAQQQLRYAQRWAAARFGNPSTRPQRSNHPANRGSKRLRVGYLSADLHEHATAYLMAEAFEHHDRERFEIFAYSYGPEDGSPMRNRLRKACEHFIDIAREPDDLAAQRIEADALDVLVDLKGYTLGDRLSIMARRPCAIQATWLGYPGTTGASFIDYMIADPVVVPHSAEQHYTERIARVPGCYQPNDRARAVSPARSREEYGLPEQAFVYCCFNQTYKITPDVFAVWMRLLQQVPESVLWLLESNALAKEHLLHAAESHGVKPLRLIFAPRMPNAQHLARYVVADLALDTAPYTSHTTMSDALWCGCAALGLCGETFAARVSSSVLMAAGLSELVTYSLEEYEALALKLAREPEMLQRVRSRVSRARDSSTLFDSRALTRSVEALYVRWVTEPCAT